ncbi:MAG TPA: polysaccharide biosynthesis/export family protein [Vicinamibacteria bacterium]|jgi:polysaccharide export outer membrane protein
MIAPGLLFAAATADVRINHPPLVCFVANRSPRIEAVVSPPDDVHGRIYFKARGENEFYSVPMVPRLGRFVGTLPRPKEKAGSVVYYIEAALPDGRVNRTSEITTRIVRDARSCPSVVGVPESVDAGDVEIFSAGTPHKPEGFDGISRVTPLAGRARASAAPAAAPAAASAQAAVPTPAPTPVATPSPPEYQIGPEDILKVTVYGHEDLTQTVVVQSDGTFVFPLIGRVKGGDLSPKELERKITVLLSQGFIRNPQVTVIVQEYRSKTIFVVGEIMRPGTYPLSGSRTLVEALAKAGPTTANAGAEVVIVRPHGEVQGPVLPNQVEGPASAAAEVIRVSMPDIQAGDLSKNVLLRPNDTVFVPLAPKVFVSGEVRNPGAYPFAPGTTVRQAISLAGGLTEDGSSGRIRVVRAAGGKSRELKIKLEDAVQPGDTIVVKSKLF